MKHKLEWTKLHTKQGHPGDWFPSNLKSNKRLVGYILAIKYRDFWDVGIDYNHYIFHSLQPNLYRGLGLPDTENTITNHDSGFIIGIAMILLPKL